MVFDGYDWRSVIENGIFKEGKYPWHLSRFPKKTEDAVIVHVHFTLLVMASVRPFACGKPNRLLLRRSRQRAVPVGVLYCWEEKAPRWRLRLKEENRDNVIVFRAQAYGIFHLAELAILTGMRLHRLPSHLGSRQTILQHYGIST